MKFQYFYISYIALGIIACLLAFGDMQYLSIAFRWLGLLVLSAVYFNFRKMNDLMFYIGIIFSGLAESMMILGTEDFHKEVNVCFSIYAFIVVFMIRNSVNKVKYQVKKEQIIPLIISTFLTIFLLFSVLDIITPKIKNNIIYSYIFVFSFLIMLSYMAVLYVSKHSKRYVWLLLLIIAFITSTTLGSLEALYYKNKLLEQGVFVIEIASHFFLLKFLITDEEDISYID